MGFRPFARVENAPRFQGLPGLEFSCGNFPPLPAFVLPVHGLLPLWAGRGMSGGKFTAVRRTIPACLAVFLACVVRAPCAQAEEPSSPVDLENLSIAQLANLDITSVSKTSQPLSKAPAAVYVITHDEIVSSGARSIPEILRLAPNLQVMQTSPSNYVITSRGLSGNNADQNFPDKLLVLIDGRSVYSPLYSGVYWDMQGVLPEDIERIEVISGPGATLWGANAVNGVINIITRKAADTQGGVLALGAGNLGSGASLQYGGMLGDNLAYRVYASDFYDKAFDRPGGSNAHDGWTRPQGGFRLDWSSDANIFSLQGDLYSGAEKQAGAPNQDISGADLVGHMQHSFDDGSTLQIQTYYDRTRRATAGGGAFTLNTYDLDVQHNFTFGSWNSIVWGAGVRIDQYRITSRISPASSLLFVPPNRTLDLENFFVQDNISLGSALDVVLGMKLENDPYSGLTPMPSVRFSWNIDDTTMLWGAISRAIRSPTPFDVDVVEKLGPTPFLGGNPNFEPEKLTAYEAGYRGEFLPDVSVSVSLFDDVYDDLKSIEFGPPFLQWGNMMKGNIYGVQAWASYDVNTWWRLSAGATAQREDFRFKPGASGLLGVAQAGDDPKYQASLHSSMRLSDAVSLQTDWRYVSALPDPKVPGYVELNASLDWKISDSVRLSLSGFNLLHAKHLEFTAPPSDEVERSFYIETEWRF